MRLDSGGEVVITSPKKVKDLGYRISGNYYFSFLIKEDLLDVCFPVGSSSFLFCFKIRNFLKEDDFEGTGWIEIYSKEKDVTIIIPPYRQGFFVGKKINKTIKVGAYSKLFWEVARDVRTLQTNWSDIPIYYSSAGCCQPSIAFVGTRKGSYVSIGDTPEGAILNAIHLRRIGYKNLKEETTRFLQSFEGLNDKVLRGNTFVSLFYSNSFFIDSDDSCIMASKSPKYYVSGGFWARDFIFWTLPIIEKYDMKRAKELIQLLFTKYWRHKGIHALYLDGRILYNGFELDQLSFYFLALERGLRYGIIEPERSLSMADELMDLLKEWKHYRYNLYRTYLNSSDDQTAYPYVTFDNVALWFSLRKYGLLVKKRLSEEKYLAYSRMIKNDILANLVKNGMFCYSTDLRGNYEFYDDPTGSLLLLPYLGFVNKNSEVFKNTLRWVKSDRNKFLIKGKFPGLGNRHVAHPWIHGISTEILSGITEPSIINKIPMDEGLSCETIDENSGKCVTGIHFPGSSGFLVQALWHSRKKNRIGKT